MPCWAIHNSLPGMEGERFLFHKNISSTSCFHFNRPFWYTPPIDQGKSYKICVNGQQSNQSESSRSNFLILLDVCPNGSHSIVSHGLGLDARYRLGIDRLHPTSWLSRILARQKIGGTVQPLMQCRASAVFAAASCRAEYAESVPAIAVLCEAHIQPISFAIGTKD